MIKKHFALLSGSAVLLSQQDMKALGLPQKVIVKRRADELIIYSFDEFQYLLARTLKELYGAERRRVKRIMCSSVYECEIRGQRTIQIPVRLMKEEVKREDRSLQKEEVHSGDKR